MPVGGQAIYVVRGHPHMHYPVDDANGRRTPLLARDLLHTQSQLCAVGYGSP